MLAAGVQELAAAVETIDLPDPRPLAGDEVLIEVRAAGVANWDEFVRTGQWGCRPHTSDGAWRRGGRGHSRGWRGTREVEGRGRGSHPSPAAAGPGNVGALPDRAGGAAGEKT